MAKTEKGHGNGQWLQWFHVCVIAA